MRAFAGLLPTLVAASLSGFAAPPQPRPVLGSVKGTVRLATPVGALADLPLNRNQDTCGHRTPDPSLVIGPGGGVSNAIVTLDGLEASPASSPLSEPARLDQKGCVFLPHVQVARVGATLEIANSDPLLHNVHAYLGSETLFNVAMPVENYRVRRKLERPGLIRLKCDAGHTWMSGYIWVSAHPYVAVTDERGAYTIEAVPSGSHEIRVWHELLGEKKVALTVTAGKTSPLDVELSAARSSR